MDPVPSRAPRGLSRTVEPEPLLVSVLALGVVAAQLALRGHDDSRLASWSWVFATASPVRLFALAAAAIGTVHLAVRWPLAARRPVPFLVALSAAAAACFWSAPEVIVATPAAS